MMTFESAPGTANPFTEGMQYIFATIDTYACFALSRVIILSVKKLISEKINT